MEVWSLAGHMLHARLVSRDFSRFIFFGFMFIDFSTASPLVHMANNSAEAILPQGKDRNQQYIYGMDGFSEGAL